jgi:quinol monooxygenase YgiN
MVIVARHITVEPQQRESYLAGCVRIVEQARRAVGCLDVAICGAGAPHARARRQVRMRYRIS